MMMIPSHGDREALVVLIPSDRALDGDLMMMIPSHGDGGALVVM